MKNIWAFDTEDDGQGNIYFINFYNGKEHFTFTQRQEAINFLRTQKGRFWATNLEYDLANIFGDDLSLVKWRFGKSKLIMAQFKRVYFYDTLNHWKMSVEEMGNRLGFQKLPFNPQLLDYCKRDTEITYLFTKEMIGFYEKLGAKTKSTIASTAFNYWKDFSGFQIPYVSKNRERIAIIPKMILEKWRLAYYGGRTEVFHIGEVKGNIFYIDINSMYPFNMLGRFCYPFTYQPKADIEAEGITFAKVRSDLKLPILPYRAKTGRLIFPNGTFQGAWTNDELRYFLENGGKILKIHGGFTFPVQCDPFTNYINLLYSKRRVARDELEKLTYKNILNNTYGKFGQGCEFTVMETYQEFLKRKNFKGSGKRFGNLVTFTYEADYPYNTNFIWAAQITARSRILLHRIMQDIFNKGNKLLYCDTDSVIFKGSLKGIKISDALGEAKLVDKLSKFNCRTNKIYKMDMQDESSAIRCKGVPSKYQKEFFETGHASYMKPLRIREALRRELRPNLWIAHEKAMVTEYSKRIVLKNGETVPIILK